jgi:hypothetical protein
MHYVTLFCNYKLPAQLSQLHGRVTQNFQGIFEHEIEAEQPIYYRVIHWISHFGLICHLENLINFF